MSNGELAGIFTPAKEAAKVFKEEFALEKTIYKAGLPDNVAKFSVDLSTARSEKPLSDVGGGERKFKHAHWYYLKFLTKGGVWTIKFVLKDKSSVSLSNTEVTKGDEVYLEFTELKFTNSTQAGIDGPTLWLERRELE